MSKMGPEDIRAEYNGIIAYHTAIVNARFTTAGLFLAGFGFLAGAVLKTETALAVKVAGCALGAWLAAVCWLLELRHRALYTSIALRAVQIEHDQWGLVGEEWYEGFFSRQHKQKSNDAGVPPFPDPDIPNIAFLGRRAMHLPLARLTTHSAGLDLLYLGATWFWMSGTVYFGSRFFGISHTIVIRYGWIMVAIGTCAVLGKRPLVRVARYLRARL